jgi:hypothetical protein
VSGGDLRTLSARGGSGAHESNGEIQSRRDLDLDGVVRDAGRKGVHELASFGNDLGKKRDQKSIRFSL